MAAGDWPMTVADVCTADTYGDYDTYEEYADRISVGRVRSAKTLDADRM